MIDTILALSAKICKTPAEWGFVCGKIAALEGDFQPRSFFEGLLRCGDNAEVRAALGKTLYRGLFPDDKSVASASVAIEAHAAAAKADIFKLCPPYPIENFFTLTARFRSFRTLFTRACAHNPKADELDALFPVFTVEEGYASAMMEHRSMLVQKHYPQTATAVERSLYLDSAACTLMKIVGDSCPAPLVRQYMHDKALLTAWSGIFRARWNGVPADTIRHWFVFEDGPELASSILAAENDMKAVVSARLSTQTAMCLEAVDAARIKADIDAATADALRDTVLTCRRVQSGPERVLSYLVSMEAELVNLELCLTSVANGIDRKTTASRLRREYA